MSDRIGVRSYVKIAFPQAHREQYPHYCALWDGKHGIVTACLEGAYVSVYVDGRVICVERDHVELVAH